MWRSFNSWWRHVYSSLHGNRNLEPQSGLKICPLANQDGCPGVRRHTFLDHIAEHMVKVAPHPIWDQGRLVYPSSPPHPPPSSSNCIPKPAADASSPEPTVYGFGRHSKMYRRCRSSAYEKFSSEENETRV